ncbi:MAG: hypothetical protein M5R36_12755 [Deltaproteobacteria bacterium]|nr:hypothetical protein [Deltaproteobacteria bacterium]
MIAAAAAHGQSAAPSFEGRYIGYAYVYAASGAGLKTELRMDIRAGEDGTVSVEMNYLDNQVARFTRARAEGASSLVFGEDVKAGDGIPARIAGRFETLDGRRVAGTIAVREKGAAGKILQTIKLLADRLDESPAAGGESG